MNSWIRTTVTTQHRDALIGKEILGAVQSKVWYLSKDTERKYDIIEEFILRCFRDLTPTPSDEEIASLLGFENVKFVSVFFQHIQTKSVVVLVYQEPTNSNKGWEVFDCQQGEINPLLREAVKLSGIEAEYENFLDKS